MEVPEEKRRFVRLNALVDVLYSKREASEKDKLSLAKNISKGGICLIVYEQLKENDLLELNICLPEEATPISAIGRVAWTKEFSIGNVPGAKRFDLGIEFVEINNEDLKKIGKYVFAHLK